MGMKGGIWQRLISFSKYGYFRQLTSKKKDTNMDRR
jgi:hypothetical protein